MMKHKDFVKPLIRDLTFMQPENLSIKFAGCRRLKKPIVICMSIAEIYTTENLFDRGVRVLLHDQLCCQ